MERTAQAAGPARRMIAALSERALLPAAGVVWRSGLLRISDACRLTQETAQGLVTVDLPGDMQRAVPKRRSEYLAGRACAALALRALNAPEGVSRKGRAPVWPAGVSGSITHTDRRVVAVAARDMRAIGVDLEPLMPPRTVAEVGHLLLSPADHAQRPADMDAARFCTLVFSAKEATYKALSPQLADIPDFHEATVTDLTATRLTLVFRDWRIPVLHGLDDGDCVTLALLPQGEIPR